MNLFKKNTEPKPPAEPGKLNAVEEALMKTFISSGILPTLLKKIFNDQNFAAVAKSIQQKFLNYPLLRNELGNVIELMPIYTLRTTGDELKFAIITLKEVMVPVDCDVEMTDTGPEIKVTKWDTFTVYSRTLETLTAQEFINQILPPEITGVKPEINSAEITPVNSI